MAAKLVNPLINTPLQRGGCAFHQEVKRFSGFLRPASPCDVVETAKAVGRPSAWAFTPLKRGVNERTRESAPNPLNSFNPFNLFNLFNAVNLPLAYGPYR